MTTLLVHGFFACSPEPRCVDPPAQELLVRSGYSPSQLEAVVPLVLDCIKRQGTPASLNHAARGLPA
jgi:hypothetical protein